MKDSLRELLRAEQSRVDSILRSAADLYYEQHGARSNFKYDTDRCIDESYNLIKGKDLCYDRPGVGLSYSLWYHGRRMNSVLPFFVDALVDRIQAGGGDIEVFDLGAGTGAVQMAAGLAAVIAQRHFGTVPQIRIVNVDSSPFMLAYNKRYLWEGAFIKHYPEASNLLLAEYEVNAWPNTEATYQVNPWFVASYLFDHVENHAVLRADFLRLVERYKPERVFLSTSAQPKKRDQLDGVGTAIQELAYAPIPYNEEQIFHGQMTEVSAAHKSLNQRSGTSFRNTPSWDERSFYGKALRNEQAGLSLTFTTEPKNTGLALYAAPIRVRREVALNEEQIKASRPSGRPTYITGPAGCGKSVVITERIRNLVQESAYSPDLRILLTSFNKQLTSYLGKWTTDLLNKERISVQHETVHGLIDATHITFHGSSTSNITVLNFDKLPRRIGGVKDWTIVPAEPQHHALIEQAIASVRSQNGLNENEHIDILNAHYVYDEYHLVYYGQLLDDYETYLSGSRTQRLPAVPPGSPRRKLLADTIQTYLNTLAAQRKASFICMRRYFLEQLRTGKGTGTFTHVFVDEFQDCTQADYSIFFALLSDNNNITIAGDYAQAVHTGRSARLPREGEEFAKTGRKMANWSPQKLNGSYRCPFRISQCLEPLSAHIRANFNDMCDLIVPYKGAPPGARPIIVWAEDVQGMMSKVRDIMQTFSDFGEASRRITILERDGELSEALGSNGVPVETSTILKLKGMEKECVLWSTRARIDDEEEKYHFVYTILTRTCSLLIVALSPDRWTAYDDIIRMLDPSLMIVWDEQTASALKSTIKHPMMVA